MVGVRSLTLTLLLHLSLGSRIVKRQFLDSSVITQANGKLGMYLNVPTQCTTVYDSIIAKLEACKSGDDLGHPNLESGCLIQVTLDDSQHRCVYDDLGNVQNYNDPPQFSDFNEELRNGNNNSRRPSRKEIVDFLLGLLDETESTTS